MLRRRTFLTGLLTLGGAAVGVTRRLWAQGAWLLRYRSLTRPIVIALEDLSAPWRARAFTADAVTLASAANPNQPIRVSGMIVRTEAGGTEPERFSAVSARCPHEGCDVDFVADPSQLPAEVIGEIGHTPAESVYICPCHNSTFSGRDGARLAGPAPRGLYRFRVTAVRDASVEIGEVEEDVLIFV